jgi:hypothetical protein
MSAVDAAPEPEREQLHDENLVVRKDGSVEFTPLDYWKGSKLPKWLQTAITDFFIFVVIHYNMWLAPFVFLFYYLIQVSHGNAMRVASGAVLTTTLYNRMATCLWLSRSL